MTKQELLRTMRLLSALETVMMLHKDRMPDYLIEDVQSVVEILEREILNGNS